VTPATEQPEVHGTGYSQPAQDASPGAYVSMLLELSEDGAEYTEVGAGSEGIRQLLFAARAADVGALRPDSAPQWFDLLRQRTECLRTRPPFSGPPNLKVLGS
jgi:hypothetical protein